MSQRKPGVYESMVLEMRNQANEDVTFLWTEKHLHDNHYFTCVTSRHSGGSYLYGVELIHIFSEQPFYRNYSTLDSHNFSCVCLLIKMAS